MMITGQPGHPQPGLPIPELFSRLHSGTCFCTFLVACPGNSANNVDPADPTKFVAFPGNSTNNVDKNPDLAFLAKPGMPSLAFCRHYLLSFLEMSQISLGQRGRHYLSNFLEMRQISCRKKFQNGAQKKVPETAGLAGSSGPRLGSPGDALAQTRLPSWGQNMAWRGKTRQDERLRQECQVWVLVDII